MQPRLTAFYGDRGREYKYSGTTMKANAWSEPMQLIKIKVEQISEAGFNVALLNCYRDGNDSVGWHRDHEKGMGPRPMIGLVSFGETRIFQMRTYKEKTSSFEIPLAHGSLLLMMGESQVIWEHQVPKTKKIVSPRINITLGKF